MAASRKPRKAVAGKSVGAQGQDEKLRRLEIQLCDVLDILSGLSTPGNHDDTDMAVFRAAAAHALSVTRKSLETIDELTGDCAWTQKAAAAQEVAHG